MTVSGLDLNTAYVRVLCVSGALSGTVAKYAKPASGVLEIDLTDLVRVVSAGTVIIGEYTSSDVIIGSTVSKSWTRAGLIDPSNVIAPESEIGLLFNASVFAPSVMLQSATSAKIAFEIYSTDGYDFSTGRVKELPSETVQNFARSIEIGTATAEVEFWHLNDIKYGAITLQELDECKKYATVEWVSFSGATRRHTFEVINCTTESIDAVSLQNLRNFYDEHKGRQDKFVLRIEGLNRYDYWYYADLITSDKVQLTFDGVNYKQIQVVTKSVTIPDNDEGELNTLEIEINFAKYDTI